ncbi:RnfH family protein [Coxiella endosymbiont of Ornithodoros amblus]|uniref:RnfH family protein n=1 Tax=Coxiella endosymbiont of Ornithodoros amblus TaxID=1656166 RepID=UPI00244DF677|nr:RnfH family protein [Coxiella endosymbiont of Ornithodoros amblus]MBW5803111.1 RnfH family protein [Coxiella endosymbiont of Ornithodoros amblus]
MISVIVAYAIPEKQVEIPLTVEESCTLVVAVKRSGILQQFPELNLSQAIVGIHNKRTTLDSGLRDGDRIEIYRPLTMDPKQARLLRAKRGKIRQMAKGEGG